MAHLSVRTSTSIPNAGRWVCVHHLVPTERKTPFRCAATPTSLKRHRTSSRAGPGAPGSAGSVCPHLFHRGRWRRMNPSRVWIPRCSSRFGSDEEKHQTAHVGPEKTFRTLEFVASSMAPEQTFPPGMMRSHMFLLWNTFSFLSLSSHYHFQFPPTAAFQIQQ